MSKCPKCSQFVSSVSLAEVNVNAGTKQWVGVSYSCPFCFSVLSVGIDPVALKSDTVSDVTDEMAKVRQDIAALRSQLATLLQQLVQR